MKIAKLNNFIDLLGYVNDGFLRAIKIRSTPSFGWEVKRESPMS
jgi:hypothetical protein